MRVHHDRGAAMIEIATVSRTPAYVVVTLNDGPTLGAEVKDNHTNVYFLSPDHSARALIDSRATRDEAVAVADVLFLIAQNSPPVRRAVARLAQLVSAAERV